MSDKPKRTGYGGIGSHSHGKPIPIEEATRKHLEFLRASAEQPGNREYEEALIIRKQRREREKLHEKPGGLIGPPNPFKPHRKG